MKIKFVQRTTLVDYPGKVACTLFLFGCNFRCGFCYNPDLVLEERSKDLDLTKILNFLEKRKDKLDAVCITGGEPFLNLSEEFIVTIKNKGYLVKIDTNGSFPEKLENFVKKRVVDYIAMDIKGRREDYKRITNFEIDLEEIERSIKIISSLENYEFRTTIVERFHDEKKIVEMVNWLSSLVGKKMKRFVLQGFKNKDKFIDESFSKEKSVTEDFLRKIKETILKEDLFEEVEIRV